MNIFSIFPAHRHPLMKVVKRMGIDSNMKRKGEHVNFLRFTIKCLLFPLIFILIFSFIIENAFSLNK